MSRLLSSIKSSYFPPHRSLSRQQFRDEHRNVSSTVVKFTDPFGRTSCAKDEREHYRLRCLTLTRVHSAVRENARSERAQVAELEDLVTKDTSFTDDAGYGLRIALYKKRIRALRSIAGAAEAKLARVEAGLDAILKHNDLTKQFYEKTFFEKLPRELRDMVYDFINPCPKVLDVDYITYITQIEYTANTQQLFERVYRSDSQYGSFNGKYCKMPRYLDVNVVGPKFAEEMMKAFHRKTVFAMYNLKYLKRFLNENRWRGFEHLVPNIMVHNIHILISLNQCIPHAYYQAQMIERLVPLQSLTQGGVRITIDVRPVNWDWHWLTDDIEQAVAKESSHGGRFGHWPMENMDDFELVTRKLLIMTLSLVLPLLRSLFDKGHVITIMDSREKWSWVMSKDNISVDDAIKCRGAFWVKRPWGVLCNGELVFEMPCSR